MQPEEEGTLDSSLYLKHFLKITKFRDTYSSFQWTQRQIYLLFVTCAHSTVSAGQKLHILALTCQEFSVH